MATKVLMPTERPGGGVGGGGSGISSPTKAETPILINKNKSEVNILLFCSFMGFQK